jgi:hypothetical protein
VRRFVASAVLALALAVATLIPAAAKDTYALFGPLEVQIAGADGDLRQFMALSADDRRAAAALVAQLAGAIQGGGQAIDPTPPPLPHYWIGVSHMGLNYPTMPWSSTPHTRFVYYPGGDGKSFLVAEFSQPDGVVEARSIQPSPDVAAMIQRHLEGLAPIDSEGPAMNGGTTPWAIALGAVLLLIVTAMLAEDRRRWRRGGNGAPAKGT